MLFNSPDFLLFLPIVFGLYWFFTQRSLKAQNLLLLTASYVFYGWWDWRFLGLIALSTIVDFLVGIRIEEAPDKARKKRWLWIEGNEWPLAKVDTLYYDDHHLRGVGAELYSEWLAGQVKSVLDSQEGGGL